MYNKILIPLDGSKTAEKVLPYARYLAGKFKIPVELLAAIDIAEMATHLAAEKARLLDTMIEDGVRNSTAYLRLIANTFPGINVTCTVDRARAEDAIIEKAAADKGLLITMATHGRSGLNRFLLGSVAEKVLRGSVNPDKDYFEKIHPEKMRLSLEYIRKQSLWLDCQILATTLGALVCGASGSSTACSAGAIRESLTIEGLQSVSKMPTGS